MARKAVRVVNMIIAIATLLVGLFIVGLGISFWREDSALRRECTAQADCVVTNIEHSLTSKKKDKYTITYTYSVEGAEYVAETSEVANNPKFDLGDSVTLFYEPSNPERYYIAEIRGSVEEQATGAIFTVTVGCVWILVTQLILWYQRRR